MRISEILLAVAAVAPFVAAHGDVQGMPNIFGLGAGALRPRDFSLPSHRASGSELVHKFNKRQGGSDGRCGTQGNGASCDTGYCCSSAGYCGNDETYCAAPDCQINFGPNCDANKVPNGATTRNIARPQLGSVQYGGNGIYNCKEPGTIAITYDDGPYIYTNQVLDQFASYNMKATFFVTGNNNGKGAIDDAATAWPAVISRMYNEGHQVASHTWSHQDLSVVTQTQRINQMVYNEMAIRNIIQRFPTYMRPPYSSCTAACQADLKALGYVVTYFDLDTDDYNNITPEKIQNAKDNFSKIVKPSNPTTDDFLAIGHDIHEQTALNLTGYMLDMIRSKGYRGVTVGECLGDPVANWYRSSSGTTVSSSPSVPSATQSQSTTVSSPIATPTGTSQDGICGAKVGLSCIGFSAGSCCSQYGYCGASIDHCGTGCQSGFGTCGSSDTAIPSSSVSSTTSAAPTNAPAGPVSTDGTCGGTKGSSCIGFPAGSCCSQYGYCGNTTDYCGTGCNPLYGICGNGGTSSVVFSEYSSSSTASGRPSISIRCSSSTVSVSSTVRVSSSPASSLASLRLLSSVNTTTAVTPFSTRNCSSRFSSTVTLSSSRNPSFTRTVIPSSARSPTSSILSTSIVIPSSSRSPSISSSNLFTPSPTKNLSSITPSSVTIPTRNLSSSRISSLTPSQAPSVRNPSIVTSFRTSSSSIASTAKPVTTSTSCSQSATAPHRFSYPHHRHDW